MGSTSASRRADLDNLKTCLTVLVVCHHSAIAFGASGGWYYVVPPPAGSAAPQLLTLFCAVNQAFFMSLFFGISAYFTVPACDARGAGAFARDRLVRLGIPLVVYFFVLNPLVVYVAARLGGTASGGFGAFLVERGPRAFGPGPLWFVLALLLFSLAYAALHPARAGSGSGTDGQTSAPRDPRPFPEDSRILGFVVAMGLVAFVVRLFFPVGWNVVGLQLGYFPLYVAFFVLGLRARRHDWLARLEPRRARRWFHAALAAILLLPPMMLLGSELPGGADGFRGGWTAQSLLYAMWEPVVCVGVSLELLVRFRERHASATPLAARASRDAYAAYIVHPLLVVPLTAAVALLPAGPITHFLLLGILATGASFAVADLVRRAPGLSRIL